MRSFVLGLDIGSSSMRAALFDDKGRMLEGTLARRDHEDAGAVEFEAEKVFVEVCGVIDDVLARSQDLRSEITHVASCVFWHSLLGVSSVGKSTTKVLTWADTRSGKYTHLLGKRFDGREPHNRTGARFHSSFWPARLLWLRKEFPKAWKRTARWLSLSDYILLKLCGTAVTSVSMASGTGIFDQRDLEWDKELLRYLGIRKANLAAIVQNDISAYSLKPEFHRRWPRLVNSRWFPAVGDGAANNIGVGCVTRRRAALMVGTSGAMRIAYEGTPPKKMSSGLWCYRVDRKRVIVGGALSDGGNLYRSLKETLRIELSDEAIGNEIARRGADAHGLTVMPFFFGERSTGYSEAAGGSVIGLTGSHDAIDILQAAMEAIANRFAAVFDHLKTVCSISDIVASGGALEASPVWTQIIADVLGRDLLLCKQREASLRGAVLLALETIGKIEDLESIKADLEPKNFHPKCHAIYRKARKRHENYYRLLMGGKS